MGIFEPIYVLINIALGCSISALDYFEGLLDPSSKPDNVPEHQSKSPGVNAVSNAECPPPSTPGKNMKRIKLLLNIMISPRGSRVVNVSTRNVMDTTSPSILESLISWFTILVVTAIQITKWWLLWLNHVLTGVDLPMESSQSGSPLANGQRKMISPKRRIPHYRRLLARFPFKMIGLGEKKSQFEDFTLCVSQPENPESESANTSLNNSRSQGGEKRKRPEDEESDPSSEVASSDDGETVLSKTPVVESTEDEVDEEVDESAEGSYQPSSLTHRLLEIAEEEEYESAEDPDYEVSQDRIDADSSISSEDEHISESDVESELNDLRADALTEPVTTEYPVGIENEPLEAIANEPAPENSRQLPENYDSPGTVLDQNQDRHNENDNEFTNGQASMRELASRNPTLRHFYASESEASSPFSVNRSEPSVPNTPYSFGSDSSHLDTP